MNSLEKMILILTPINTLLGIIISIIQQLSKLSSSTNSFTLWRILPWSLFVFSLFGICYLTFNYKKRGDENRNLDEQNNNASKADIILNWFNKYIERKDLQYIKYLQENGLIDSKINKMHKSLDYLKKNNLSGQLDSDIYYLYIYSLLFGAKTRVWAVSMGSEWNDSEEEKEFLRMNFEVAKRKVQLERIFVIERKDIRTFLSQKPIVEQINKRNTYFKTYIAFKEDIDNKNPSLYQQLGCGFLAFDDFAIADDRFVGEDIRGFIHTQKVLYDDYNRKFTELRDFVMPLDDDFLKNNKEQ